MNIEGVLNSARSHFSIGESLLSPKKIVAIAKKNNIDTLALVDVMTISGMSEFVSECNKADIKPIVGCTLRVVTDINYRKPSKAELVLPKANPEWRCKVYVKNDAGIFDLMNLLSLANSEHRFYGNARLSLEDVINMLKNDNLLFSTGDFHNLFTVHDASYNYQSIVEFINRSISLKNIYLEQFNAESILIDTLNNKSLKTANFELFEQANRIVTNLILYENQTDTDTLEVLSTIASNGRMSDAWRNKQWIKTLHSKSPNELKEELEGLQSRLKLSEEDIEKLNQGLINFKASCAYQWKPMPISLPKMADNESAEMIRIISEGWKKRIKLPVMGYSPSAELVPIYKDRLVYELTILRRMKFERYFLLVHDLVKWSKDNEIFVGPGRGSIGGSLIAFLMGITDIDPIRFNLIFERFINPDRLDLPDADLDFMSSRRHEVIEYLVAKYGEDRVAGVSNYASLVSASALRNCGRVYGLSAQQLEPTRYVPKVNGTPFTLTEAAKTVKEIDEFKGNYPQIWRHALGLEGVMRSLGKHAAGIVVADEPIANRAVIEIREQVKVVNWDRSSIESWGLVKLDILGLSTLDVLRITLNYIREIKGIEIVLTDLPMDDEQTMKGLSEGKTAAIFQLAGAGMSNLLKSLAKNSPLTFDDICATTALFRPGPIESGMLGTYVDVRQGNTYPEYIHEKLKPALESTGGVFVYQEQTMQVARDLAGFSMADADVLRKAIGKKDASKMTTMRDKFINGCMAGFVKVKTATNKVEEIHKLHLIKMLESEERISVIEELNNGLSEMTAIELWEGIEKNASYQFNLAHSVEYSVISYWAMYLKTHYPAEFFAATLSVEDKEEKLMAAIVDAQKYNIFVVPPDINLSTNRFEIHVTEDEIHLIAPFNKMKGLSSKTSDAIIGAREKVGGIFTSRKHLTDNVAKRNCNINHMKVLDLVGSFASLESESLPIRHPDRLKDQMEFLPGLILSYIKSDRYTMLRDIATQSSTLIREIKECKGCDLSEHSHTIPISGEKIKFMVILDNASTSDTEKGKILSGSSSKPVFNAIKEAGLKKSNGYYTSLVKIAKPKEIKSFSTNQQLSCRKFINREIEVVNPAVIVCLGGAAIRHFYPDIKGSWSELCGRVVYNKQLDASIVFGITPGMTFFREEAVEMLNDVFRKVYEMVS